jgi:hypothetical protein
MTSDRWRCLIPPANCTCRPLEVSGGMKMSVEVISILMSLVEAELCSDMHAFRILSDSEPHLATQICLLDRD